MSTPTRVAIVTGSNQGIGFAIVKGLAKQFNGVVYLTARNVENGKKAVEELAAQGLNVNFHQLDIEDQVSIDKIAIYLKEKYGGLDVLVNNAAVVYQDSADPRDMTTGQTDINKIEHTIAVGYFGTLSVCNALFPLLRPHARVVQISSRLGTLTLIKDPNWRKRFEDEHASIEDISNILREYLELAREGKHLSICSNSYFITKAGLNAITKIQQRAFSKDNREDLIVNSVSPGFVKTRMTNGQGLLTPDEGAITSLYLALLAPNVSEPKGEFWAEMKPCDPNWTISK